jgi:hypothetical protein
MSTVFVIRKKENIVGIFDDLTLYFRGTEIPDFGEKESIIFEKYIIEKMVMNNISVKPNQIMFKGKDFNLNNLHIPIPLLDVSDPSFL